MKAEPPDCRLGGKCDLMTRGEVYGQNARDGLGVAQCANCSIVYDPVAWQPRGCDFCGLLYGESNHDPCLGEIPGVRGACCGHGDPSKRYGVPEGWPIRGA